MTDRKLPPKGVSVPSGRLSRLARFGSMATGVAGGMLIDGARQFARGQRPTMSALLLTPANAIKVTHQLAQLRGAAMKMGQLMSMDGGDMLPPELTDILGRLRADAQNMPHAQLRMVLDRNWGKGWERRFASFDYAPIAAASIGQVHRARTADGRNMAVKVQYPGVRKSIDSDVDNVASLLRLSGLLPKTMDVAPLLAEAKRQLHEEADYVREAQCLTRFADLLADAPDFVVPALHEDFSTSDVLAMGFSDSVPVETLVSAPQTERDRVMKALIALLLRELFDFRLMQTDPNFANYRYEPHTGRIVLLDFGATRAVSADIAHRYRALMMAGLGGERAAMRDAALAIGFLDARAPQSHQDAVMRLFDMAMEPLRQPGPFDFGRSVLAAELRDEGMTLATQREHWHVPPVETLFLQRKFGGMFLLASRLKARVDVRTLLERYPADTAS